MTSKKPDDVGNTVSDVYSAITAQEFAYVKTKMMSHDPDCQTIAVSWIAKKLNAASDNDRQRLIEHLIWNDVLTYLCEQIACSTGKLYISMLGILEKLTCNHDFYKHLAKSAINYIHRVAFIMAKKIEVHEEALTAAVYTIYVVLDGASKFEESLDKVCDLKEMVHFLKIVNPNLSCKYVLRLGISRLLCLIMQNVKLGSDEAAGLCKVFRNSTLSIGSMVAKHRDSKDSVILCTLMGLICNMCAIGVRFCEEPSEEDFAKEITMAMIEIVIPEFKETEFKSDEYRENLKYFVECLDQIFQLDNCNGELADVLATNGYLKYLLHKSDSSLQKSKSSLLSHIILELVKDDHSCGDGLEGLPEIQDRINKGILALMSRMDYYPDTSSIVTIKGEASDTFLLLFYYHSVKTHEYILMELPSMTLRVTSLPDIQLIPVLKATWFLFVVSSLNHSEADSVCHYSQAVTRLAEVLQNHDLRKCYTHDRAILEHSLDSKIFPVELQCEIVRLWLDFDGDVKYLLARKNSEMLTECLVSTVEKSSEKLVNRALEVVAKMQCDEDRSAKIISRVWERLPGALGSCNVETAANVKGLLKLVQCTSPEGDCAEINEVSAATLAKVLTAKEFDDELKILVLQHVYALLNISSARKSSAAVEFCINEPQLLRTLRDEGFARANFELSGFCIDLLAYIVECQQEFKVQCNDDAVLKLEPLKMLVLLARSNRKLCQAAVRLLVSLLNDGATIGLSVTLADFENAEAAEEAVLAWYRILIPLFFKRLPSDWLLIYRCLIAVLDFCEKNKFLEILKKLCDYSGTYELVRFTIDHEYTNPIFFRFTNVWLGYGIKYGSANVVHANYCRRFQNLSISEFDEFDEFDEFEDVIKILTEYTEKHNNSVSDNNGNHGNSSHGA